MSYAIEHLNDGWAVIETVWEFTKHDDRDCRENVLGRGMATRGEAETKLSDYVQRKGQYAARCYLPAVQQDIDHTLLCREYRPIEQVRDAARAWLRVNAPNLYNPYFATMRILAERFA